MAKKKAQPINHTVVLPEHWHGETIHVYQYMNFIGRDVVPGANPNWEVRRSGVKLEQFTELRAGDQLVLTPPRK